MPIFHAFPRKKRYTYDLPYLSLVFEPNAAGDVVAEVTDERAIAWFESNPSHFRLYAEPAEAPPSPLLTVEGSPFVLVDDERSVDLRTMTDAELREFAEANGVKVHHKAKGETIRTAIVEALK